MAEQRATGITTPGRRGPAEGEKLIGWDRAPERRPGVPQEAEPHAVEGVAGRALPLQQNRRDERLHRVGLDGPTPVYGNAQPRHGLSGAMRRAAYEIPEHQARHWMLLMLADRTNVLEDRLGSAFLKPADLAEGHGAAARVRARPWLALGAVAGGVLLARRLMR